MQEKGWPVYLDLLGRLLYKLINSHPHLSSYGSRPPLWGAADCDDGSAKADYPPNIFSIAESAAGSVKIGACPTPGTGTNLPFGNVCAMRRA